MCYKCILCESLSTKLFHHSENREYHHCNECDLVFVPPKFWVSTKDEKKKYDNHQNSPDDSGYCSFLDRLLLPLQSYLKDGAKGLDFGSGPGPTLSYLMEQRGYEMDIYDIFYHDEKSLFQKRYEFITTTEVIEHLHHPMDELKRLWSMLEDGGVLGLMTAFRVDGFENWYYKRDLTHIAFYTPKTFEFISKKLGAKIVYIEDGVVIMQKDKNEKFSRRRRSFSERNFQGAWLLEKER